MNRIGDWIQTSKGHKFFPFDPRPEEIDIDDIAHALSMMCRFGGHPDRFYSVAEHSFHCSQIVPQEDALAALLHDASEAYLVDVPRPIKRFEGMQSYRDAEAHLTKHILYRWNLDVVLPSSVKLADERMLAVEATTLFKSHPDNWPAKYQHLLTGTEPQPLCWAPSVAKVNFLTRFEQLIGIGA